MTPTQDVTTNLLLTLETELNALTTYFSGVNQLKKVSIKPLTGSTCAVNVGSLSTPTSSNSQPIQSNSQASRYLQVTYDPPITIRKQLLSSHLHATSQIFAHGLDLSTRFHMHSAQLLQCYHSGNCYVQVHNSIGTVH